MMLDVAGSLLATYFIYIRESNRADCFCWICLLLCLYFKISFVVIESSRFKINMIANFNSISCGELILFLKYTGGGEGSKIIEKTLNIKILLSRQFMHWSSFQTEIKCLDPLRAKNTWSQRRKVNMFNDGCIQ